VPYEVVRDTNACPVSKPWSVRNQQSHRNMGCHATRAEAMRQLAALYANEPGLRAEELTPQRVFALVGVPTEAELRQALHELKHRNDDITAASVLEATSAKIDLDAFAVLARVHEYREPGSTFRYIKYSPDQPRDEQGRFGEGGGGGDRIAPISGASAKESIKADLTMASLPDNIQAKVSASFGRLGVTPDQARDNLVAMYEKSSPQLREEFKPWYREAQQFNNGLAEKYGLDPRVTAGITAANSPGGQWEANKMIADTVASTWVNRDAQLTQEQADKINAVLDRPDTRGGRSAKPITDYRVSAGQSIGEVMHDDARAGAVTIGRMNGLQLRSYDNLTKSVEILTAGDQVKAVDDVLNGPKVRSFYNNMTNPGGREDTCIDKHMMRAVVNGDESPGGHDRMRSIENDSKITSNPRYLNSSVGAYPLMADVVRSATDSINQLHLNEAGYPLLPNEVQAVIWGQQLHDFPLGRIRNVLSGKES